MLEIKCILAHGWRFYILADIILFYNYDATLIFMFFSERELKFMIAICRRPSVCLSVVCNVRAPYSGDWNFRQYFYAVFGTLAIHDLSVKNLRRSSQGNPSVGGVKHKRGSRMDLSNAISRKRCKIGAKLLLITNRKWHMSFRLVPNTVTLDDLERRNSPNRRVISTNSVAFRAD